jgi:hypothetical protein
LLDDGDTTRDTWGSIGGVMMTALDGKKSCFTKPKKICEARETTTMDLQFSGG